MSTDMLKKVSNKYCPRFGQIAVEMNFVTEDQVMEAFHCQHEDAHSGQDHRLLGSILLDKGWITSDQIEEVLNSLLKQMRLEDAGYQPKTNSTQNQMN